MQTFPAMKFTFPKNTPTAEKTKWRIFAALRRARHECLRCSDKLGNQDRHDGHQVCSECRRIMAYKHREQRAAGKPVIL